MNSFVLSLKEENNSCGMPFMYFSSLIAQGRLTVIFKDQFLIIIMHYFLILKPMLIYSRQSRGLRKWQNKPPISLFSSVHSTTITHFLAKYIFLYLFFYLSLSMIFHGVLYYEIFFMLILQNVTLNVCIIFHFMEYHNHLDQSFFIVHLDCFQVFAIINESAMSILCINVCLFLVISLGLIPIIEDVNFERPYAFQNVYTNLPSLKINVNGGLSAYLIISLINSVVYFIFCWECYKGIFPNICIGLSVMDHTWHTYSVDFD